VNTKTFVAYSRVPRYYPHGGLSEGCWLSKRILPVKTPGILRNLPMQRLTKLPFSVRALISTSVERSPESLQEWGCSSRL
jgi:hypothetical protein